MTQVPPSTISVLLGEARQRLAAVSESPGLDAQLLLADILQIERASVLAHPEYPVEDRQAEAFRHAMRRYLGGEPLPYVLGWWEFYGRRFRVGDAVLIPRPETEQLVETGVTHLRGHPEARKVLDVGTGSGCIAITLARECPQIRVVATDVSLAALRLAAANAADQGVEGRIDFVECDLTTSLVGRFDLICANLPYIPAWKLPGLAVARREPHLALNGGEDGLELIRRLLATLPRLMAAGGLAVLEIEAGQGEAAEAAARAWVGAKADVRQDPAGQQRLLVVQRAGGEDED